MFKHLLLPTDGSKLSEAAIQKGVQFAKSINAKITGFYVMPEFHLFTYRTEMVDDTKEEFARDCSTPADQFLAVVEKAARAAGVACDTVLVDNLNASYHAVEDLIVHGHRRIGIIGGPAAIYTAQERLKGYRRIHKDFDIEIEEDLVLEGDYSIESGYRLMDEFLKRPIPPSAVYVTNYEMTLGAIMALNESRILVPDGISIIGFDNLQLARVVKPALSIVVQPIQAIGETAANLLLKRMKGDQTGFPAIHRLKTELVVGESVKRLI